MQTVDEAVFDMDQLDHDFHLFRELRTGEDSLSERLPDGTYRVQRLHPDQAPISPGAYDITVDNARPPALTVDEAIEQLGIRGERFVFSARHATGRGNVVYRRYDGHYGLITLGPAEEPAAGQ